jgi:hypothetical protein
MSCDPRARRSTDSVDPFDRILLEDFPVSPDACLVLQQHGVGTVGELRRRSARDLAALDGLPPGTLEDVVAGLDSCGLELAGEAPARARWRAVAARLGGSRRRRFASIATASTAVALIFEEVLEVTSSLP